MKCNSCGASFDDDELFFCTVCGAMMKNPITKEAVSNEPDDTKSDLTDIAEQTVSEAAELPAVPEKVQPDNASATENTVEAVPEIEKTAETTPPVTEAIPPIKEAAPSEVENIPPVNEAPPVQNDDLYIAREREKEKMSQSVPQPVQPEVPDDTQQAPVETAPPKPIKVGAGRVLGASIIGIVAAVVLVAVSLLFSLKLGLSPDRMSKSVKKMDVWNIINAEVMDDITVSDALYYEADFNKATHGFADKSEFAFYLSQTDVTGFLSEKVRIYADYILNGKGDEPSVSENEITEFFMEYNETAKDVFSYEMQTADYNSIRSSLSDRKTSERFSVSGIGWAIKFRLENVKILLSYPTLTILAVLFLVLLIWIAIVVNHKGKHTLGLYGNVFRWGGIVTMAAGLVASPIMALMYVLEEKFHYLCLSLLLFPSAVYAVIIGAILTVAGMIFLKAKRAIKVKEKINKSKV